MKEYMSPTVELIEFSDDAVLSTASGGCKCILEDQRYNDYDATYEQYVASGGTLEEDDWIVEIACYIDTAGADEFGLHGQVT